MENDPNKKLSKGKRILKKAIRRNSKSNSNSQHSVIEQGISDSRSKSFENKPMPIETKQSASLTISDGQNEKTDRGGNAQKLIQSDKTQQERPPPVTNGHSGSRLYKVDEIKDESLEAEAPAVKKEVKLSSPTNVTRERSGLDSRKKNLKRVCSVAF